MLLSMLLINVDRVLAGTSAIAPTWDKLVHIFITTTLTCSAITPDVWTTFGTLLSVWYLFCWSYEQLTSLYCQRTINVSILSARILYRFGGTHWSLFKGKEVKKANSNKALLLPFTLLTVYTVYLSVLNFMLRLFDTYVNFYGTTRLHLREVRTFHINDIFSFWMSQFE